MIEKVNFYRFILGCSVGLKALISLMIILFAFQLETVHLIALGSSTFAAFSLPKTHSARSRNLIISYFVAIIFGIFFSWLHSFAWIAAFAQSIYLLAALSVACTILVLITFYWEHPPAAGIALGFVLNPWDKMTPVILIGAIISLVILRYIIPTKKTFSKIFKN